MNTTEYLITEAIKLCHACNRINPASFRFCRQCGVRQMPEPTNYPIASTTNPAISDNHLISNTDAEHRRTDPANSDVASRVETGRGLSHLLVGSVCSNLSASGALRVKSRLGKVVLKGLISIPILMLVLLLAPIQAYTTIRGIAEHA